MLYHLAPSMLSHPQWGMGNHGSTRVANRIFQATLPQCGLLEVSHHLQMIVPAKNIRLYIYIYILIIYT